MLKKSKIDKAKVCLCVCLSIVCGYLQSLCVCLSVCGFLASDSSDTIEVSIIKLCMVNASDMLVHHVFIILNFLDLH